MELTPQTMLALALAVTLLAMLRWILGGARRRHGPCLARAARTADAWSHVEARRRDAP